MKKLISALLFSFLAVNSYASTWQYQTKSDDFDGVLKSADIESDDGFVLFVFNDKDKNSNIPNHVAVILPKGTMIDTDCRDGCTGRIMFDNTEQDSARILGSSSYRSYYFINPSDETRVIKALSEGKTLKIQVPTYRGNKTAVFNQDKPLDMSKLSK